MPASGDLSHRARWAATFATSCNRPACGVHLTGIGPTAQSGQKIVRRFQMPSIPVRRALAVAVFLVTAVLGGATAVSAAAASPYCGITWGSLAKANGDLSPNALVNVRTGRHGCYDRVVFDFRGPATGYNVSYADQVFNEASGKPLPVAGGARLAVHLLEPAYDAQTGASTYPHGSDHVANVTGYRTLRDVVYGGSFEGHTTFGIGTRARLPFRVFTLAGPGTSSRIVIDVAHRWSQ
jgi:hypothetical protein